MRLLVTGGTGSIGHEVVRQALVKGWHCIVLSRDESLQADMKKDYPQVDFILGDVTSPSDLHYGLSLDPDYVVHAAAMKHVPICEQEPLKAVQTNVLGTMNVLRTFAGKCLGLVLISTDKTVDPCCVMGYTKKLCEEMARDPRFEDSRVMVCRFGNIIPSRGSVIPLWLEAKRKGLPLKITDPEMTRYFVPVRDAVASIFAALQHGNSGDIWMPVCYRMRMGDLLEVIAQGHPTEVIGPRPGEKKDEHLMSDDEIERVKLVDANGEFFYLINPEKTLSDYRYNFDFNISKEQIKDILNRALGDWNG